MAAVILVASVSEPSGGPPTPPLFGVPADKLLHGVAYAGLAAALAVGLATPDTGSLLAATDPQSEQSTAQHVVLLAILGAAAYGLAMEGLQYPLPYRTFDLLDAAANAVGATLGAAGWVAGALVRRRFGR